ncbi:MAG: radical SAM protein [Ardenticatenaceae bacterium]|nr:radical SAM protein [Ardenticatenaceae bacterium]
MPSFFEIAQRKLTRTTHHIYTLPIVILMPHSRCNCRCVMCDIWQANHNMQELTEADLQPHLDSLRQLHVRWVVLSGGEALMHSNLWTLCAMLKQENIKITLLSTGLLLKKHAADIVRWCDEVIVSLDGSRDVHNAIRRIPRAYERLGEGVAALRALQADYRVTGRSVLQQQNFRDLPHVIAAAHELGLDEISFLTADVTTSAFNRQQIWGDDRVAEIALSPNEVVEFAAIVEQTISMYADDFANGYVAENAAKVRSFVRYYAALNGDGNFPPVHCNAPWVSTVIEADGTVRPCFFHEALGNVRERPLADILNSPQATNFRRNLDMAHDPICRKCVCTLSLGARSEL